jgi:hypothetical protein
MFKRLFTVNILALSFFASAVTFSHVASAFEELPIVEVPIQDWAKEPVVVVDQIVPSFKEPPREEVVVTVSPPTHRPSLQIGGNEVVVVDVNDDKPKSESGSKNPSNSGTSSNRPVLQPPVIEIPEPVSSDKVAATGKKNKGKPVTSYDRPVVQLPSQERITVPDYTDLNQDQTLDFGSAELPETGEVSQVEVSTPSAPTPNPLWGMVGLGLLGAAGSATVLHFVRN